LYIFDSWTACLNITFLQFKSGNKAISKVRKIKLLESNNENEVPHEKGSHLLKHQQLENNNIKT
jgi:hypothetical protein